MKERTLFHVCPDEPCCCEDYNDEIFQNSRSNAEMARIEEPKMADPIITSPNLANATPLRQFNWMAYRDPESRVIGYGATEAEALADFNRLEAEAECDRRGCVEDCGDCPVRYAYGEERLKC